MRILGRYRLALERDSDLSVKDHQSRTILQHTAMGGSADMVEWLLSDEDRRYLNVEDIDGLTPLHWAFRSGANKKIVGRWIYRTDSGQRTQDGWTPEDICASHNAQGLLLTMDPGVVGFSHSDTLDQSGFNGTSGLARNWKTRSTHLRIPCDWL